ncbi:unnamed protein product, partial [Meganyctiphanes norvegica]
LFQISICKAFCGGSEGSYIAQDLVLGNGVAITESDSLQVSYTTWGIENCKKGTQITDGVSSRRIRLSKSGTGWELGLQGACCNGRRIVLSKDGSGSVVLYDVTIEKVKRKGDVASGRNSPAPIAAAVSQNNNQIVNHKQGKPLHPTPVNILHEDTGGGLVPQVGDEESQSRSRRSSLKARMARVGHALLPPKVTSHYTDSESELEDVSHRQRHLSHTSSIAESLEELSATPALSHSRTLSQGQLPQQHGHNQLHPDIAARTASAGLQQPQQVVVYQSMPWQHQQGVPAIGYTSPPAGQMSAANSSVHSTPSTTSTMTPSNDSTMSLLFSETRSQNTELRISVAKIQDRIDAMMTKFEKLEMKNQNSAVLPYGGHSSSVPVSGDPHLLLEQITSLVTDNDTMKEKIVESEKKITSLNESIHLLLQKNQKLLEEKTDMLVSEQKSQRDNSSANLTEVISLREEKATITAHLSIAQTQCEKLKGELVTSQNKVEFLEKKIVEFEVQLKQTENQSNLDESSKELTAKKISDLEIEKDQLSSRVEETSIQMKALQQQLQETQEKHSSVSHQLEDVRSERETLQMKLEKSQKEFKQNINHSEATGENGIGLRKELEAAYLQIKKLEEEVLLKEVGHNKEEIEKLQVQVNQLMSDKTQCEQKIEELKSASSPDQSSSMAMVKKVMNGVFRSLKPQFNDSDMYEGEQVKQIILDVIRDTTLQLLESLQTSQEESKVTIQQKDEEREQKEVVSNDTLASTDDSKDMCNSVDNTDKELNQPSNVGEGSKLVDDITNNSVEEGKAVEDLGSVKSNHKDKDLGHDMNSSTNSVIDDNDFDNIVDTKRDEVVDLDVNNGENSLSVQSDVTSNNVPDLLSQITEEGDSQSLCVGNNEIQYKIEDNINRINDKESENLLDNITSQEPNVLTQIQNTEVQSLHNSEQINSLNWNNSDFMKEQVIDQSNNEESRSDVVSEEVINKEAQSRVPVIDMENTGHRYEKSVIIEKSDSSRDSSLERALRPQPPPPPLFSDEEEDDDDWLS